MSYVDQGMTGSKLTSLLISIGIVAGIGLAMVIGLAVDAVKKEIERVTTVNIEEEPPPPEEEPPPPPEPTEVVPPPPVAPPPPINIAPAPPPIATTPTIPPPAPPALVIPPPAPPAPPPPPSLARGASAKNQSRWARRISENYPSRALREEVEGNVGVTVSIGANGRVSGCR
ncbi:MAG: energy transducer TonB, partial [Pseudomonadota bacterium]